MKPVVIERLLWGGVVVALGAAIIGLRAGPTPVVSAASAIRAAPAELRQLSLDSLTSGAAFVVENDPFRLTRRPSTTAYSPALDGLAPPPESKEPRPSLVLRGIIGGPPWSAIIEGIPGRNGSVVLRRGDTIDALRVRAVRPDTVVIEAPDTTWRLTVKRM